MEPPSMERLQLNEDPLQPLRQMADRVGKEVEQFAERLDSWVIAGRKSEEAKHKANLKLVDQCRDIAANHVRDLKQQTLAEGGSVLDAQAIHDVEANAPKSQSEHTYGKSMRTPHPGKVSPIKSALREWQEELATWELVRILYEHYHPEPGTDPEAAKRDKLATVGGSSLQCPKSEVWERFIISDDLAREKKVVVEWLQQKARVVDRDTEAILAEWTKQSGKHVDTWTSGPLETKAAIKQAKRLQAVEGPLPPGTTVSARTDTECKPLVTQLDPDAQTRQHGALEKGDRYYEHGISMVLYEMLRRGESMSKINEWCKERKQGFRAIALGASGYPGPEGAPNMAPRDFGYMHRRAAYAQAQGSIYRYEAAALGLISGHFQKVQDVSTSWDDHLYAYYSALLVSRFDNFLLTEPKEHPRARKIEKLNFPGVMEHLNYDWENATQKILGLLMEGPCYGEAITPIKLIQSALLTQTLDELVHKVGVALADAGKSKNSPPNLIIDPDHSRDAAFLAGADGPFSETGVRSVKVEHYYRLFLRDPRALRILVTVFIMLGNPRDNLTREQRFKLFARGNVIATYIELLQSTQRLQTIPVYAAQMEPWRGSKTLARTLRDITNRDDQDHYVELMKRYDIDVEGTFSKYFEFVMSQTGYCRGVDRIPANPISRIELRVKSSNGPTSQMWPNGQHLKDQIVGSDIRKEEDAVVECLLWYGRRLDKDEERFSDFVEEVLETFLHAGRPAAAHKLITQMGDGLEHELADIVRLMVLFQEWRTEEKVMLESWDRENTLADILEAIMALVEKITNPVQNPMESDFWEIYQTYIPELMLAFLTVLHSASFLTKHMKTNPLITALDLVVKIAGEKWITEAFRLECRMRELMDRIAEVNVRVVVVGDQSKPKFTKEGKTLQIWDPKRV